MKVADDVRSVANGTIAFAINLYARLRAEDEGNLFLSSPNSVSAALAITYAGAKGS